MARISEIGCFLKLVTASKHIFTVHCLGVSAFEILNEYTILATVSMW